MKNLKNILLSILTLAMVMCFGMSDEVNVFADENVTVIFHYNSAEASNCEMAIWEDGGTATNYGFTVSGNEGIVTYRCKSADTSVVGYTVKDPKYKDNADTNTPRQIEISDGASVIDVYLNPGVKEVETKVGSEVSAETTTPAAESTTPATETTTPAEESTTPATETTTPAAESTTPATEIADGATTANTETTKMVGDDPNADYSPSTVMIIIIDIVFIAAIAGISYAVCNRKQSK